MSMAETIKSIEREALREAQSHEIGGRNGKLIDCSTLEDKPVMKKLNPDLLGLDFYMFPADK